MHAQARCARSAPRRRRRALKSEQEQVSFRSPRASACGSAPQHQLRRGLRGACMRRASLRSPRRMPIGVEAITRLRGEIDPADERHTIIDDDRLLVMAVHRPFLRIKCALDLRPSAQSSRIPACRAGRDGRAEAERRPRPAHERRGARRDRREDSEGRLLAVALESEAGEKCHPVR